MSMTKHSIVRCSTQTQATCTNNNISLNRTFMSNHLIQIEAIQSAANLAANNWKRNPSQKDRSSLIRNKLTNNTTKKWTLLSSVKSWSWPRWLKSEPWDSSSSHRAELMTSDSQIFLSNSRTCLRECPLLPIRLKINIVQMGTWEVIRTSSSTTTSCRLSNRRNWSLCRIKLCKNSNNTKAKA